MPARTDLEPRCAGRRLPARSVVATLFAAQLALSVLPARAADPPRDQIADALVAEAEARGASAGDSEAQTRLTLAFAASGRASHGLLLARFHARSGHLLDALAVYRAVASQSKDAFRGNADAEAAATAKTELTALEARLPTLRARPSSGPSTRVTLDGRDVVSNAWLPLEPGKHALDASAPGFASKHIDLVLAEGDHSDTALDLAPLAPSAPVPVPPAAAPVASNAAAPGFGASAGARRQRSELPPEDTGPITSPIGHSQRVLGWLMVGTGAVGLIGGGVTAYMAHQKHQEAAKTCVGNVCSDEAGTKAYDDARTLSTLSTVSFAAGGGLAALGIGVVLSAPHPAPIAGGAVPRFSGLYVNGRF